MQNDSSLRPSADQGVDVTENSPLPDIPDAGDDSQPIMPPEPVDISTATLNADSALVANTFGDQRTLYEQAIDAYDESDAGNVGGELPHDVPGQPGADSSAQIDVSDQPDDDGGARVYDSQS